MSVDSLDIKPWTDEEAEFIISTRIRVGRNLAAFPLGPGISKQQRDEVERLVVSALSNLKGSLEGKYYSLQSLTEQERN